MTLPAETQVSAPYVGLRPYTEAERNRFTGQLQLAGETARRLSTILEPERLMAETVQDSMSRSLSLVNRGVKQAGFYVLGGAAMPAILVEIGFVTNPKEERRLKESRYRDEIAQAIYAGLAAYKRHWDQRARAVAEKPK